MGQSTLCRSFVRGRFLASMGLVRGFCMFWFSILSRFVNSRDANASSHVVATLQMAMGMNPSTD